MKTLKLFISVLFIFLAASCSSNVEAPTTITSLSNQEIKSSLSEGQFKNTIASISKITTLTRSSTVSPSEMEKNVSQELEILAADGAFIQRQLLDAPSLSSSEREKLSSLNHKQFYVVLNDGKYYTVVIRTSNLGINFKKTYL